MGVRIIRSNVVVGVENNEAEFISNDVIKLVAMLTQTKRDYEQRLEKPPKELLTMITAGNLLINYLHNLAVNCDFLEKVCVLNLEGLPDYAMAVLISFLNSIREWFDQLVIFVDRLSSSPSGRRPSYNKFREKIVDEKKDIGLIKEIVTAVNEIDKFFLLIRKIRNMVIHGELNANWRYPIETELFNLGEKEGFLGFQCYSINLPKKALVQTSFEIDRKIVPLRIFAGWAVDSLIKAMELFGTSLATDLVSRSLITSLVPASTAGIYIPAMKRTREAFMVLSGEQYVKING